VTFGTPAVREAARIGRRPLSDGMLFAIQNLMVEAIPRHPGRPVPERELAPRLLRGDSGAGGRLDV
jgi:hypothetical protein